MARPSLSQPHNKSFRSRIEGLMKRSSTGLGIKAHKSEPTALLSESSTEGSNLKLSTTPQLGINARMVIIPIAKSPACETEAFELFSVDTPSPLSEDTASPPQETSTQIPKNPKTPPATTEILGTSLQRVKRERDPVVSSVGCSLESINEGLGHHLVPEQEVPFRDGMFVDPPNQHPTGLIHVSNRGGL